MLFREGREAMSSGSYARACAKFRESNRLDPAPGTVLNIGDCEEKHGHIATAWSLFSEVTQRLPSSDERAGIASSRASALEPRLPKLRVRLAPQSPSAAHVSRDRVELMSASLDTALPVDPGSHEITVQAAGHRPSSVSVSLAEGESKTVTVSVGPQSAEVATASGKSSSKRTWGWVFGGAGVVGVGVGTVTGFMVLDKKKTVDANCDANKHCNATGADAASSGRTLGTVSGASFIFGGIALAAGAYLILSTGSEERPQTALAVGPGQVSIVGSF